MLSLTADSTETDYRSNDPPTRLRLSSSMRRALQIRVNAIASEQRAAAWEFEWLYVRQGEILDEMIERQQRCGQFRAILLADGGAHG